MKKTIFILSLLTLMSGLISCSKSVVRNTDHVQKTAGDYVRKSVKVTDFDHLDIVGPFTVTFTQRPGKPQVDYEAESDVADLVDIYSKDGTLHVGILKNHKFSLGKIKVSITAPTLDEVELTGAGSVEFAEGFEGRKLEVEVTGSGMIGSESIRCRELDASVSGSGKIAFARVACDKLEAQVTGSGKVDIKGGETHETDASVTGSGMVSLTGTTATADYEMAGSGRIQAAGLTAYKAEAEVTGSGRIECHATESLKADRTGSGKICYKGNPRVTGSPKGVEKL